LDGNDQQRRQAFAWFSRANPEHPRRAEATQRFDALFDEYLGKAGSDEFFDCYLKWASKDNVPNVLRLADHNNAGIRHGAMRLLAKFKEPRAAEPIAARLEKGPDRQVATDVLIDMGTVAEPAVLKYYHHPDAATRSAAQKVIQAYNTSADVLLTQCIADIDSADAKRRGIAVQTLVKTPVDPRRRADVATALNKTLDGNVNFFFNKDLGKALEAWGTDVNTPSLVRMADANGKTNKEAIRILGKIREPEATKALAGFLKNNVAANDVRNALKDIGSPAEPAVLAAMADVKDTNAARNFARLLADIGTKERSVPALKGLGERFPQDAILRKLIATAEQSINARST
jgi:HEAT repeat protein